MEDWFEQSRRILKRQNMKRLSVKVEFVLGAVSVWRPRGLLVITKVMRITMYLFATVETHRLTTACTYVGATTC